MPAFAVGRPGWDNWFIYHAYRRRIPVVDGSDALTLIHQYHDYSHMPSNDQGVWEGPEADRNRRLAGGWDRLFSLEDATHGIGRRGVYTLRDPRHVDRRVERMRTFDTDLFQRLRFWKLRRMVCWLFPGI